MFTELRSIKLKEQVEEVLKKELSVRDVQNTLNYHCNSYDEDFLVIEQLQNRKFRGLVE